MSSRYGALALLSSLVLRLSSYIFLRWIPGHHFPPLVFASAIIYCVSFICKLLTTSRYNVLADKVDVVIHPVGIIDVPAAADGVSRSEELAVEEVDIQETILLEEKQSHVLSTLLTGVPSPTSLLWSAVTFLLNLALVAMVLDMTYRAPLFWPAHDLSFARLGYVSSNSARLLVREPDVKQYPVFLSYRYADIPTPRKPFDSAWKQMEAIKWLSEETDFTAALEIDRLLPDTRYQYAFSNNHSGFFVTAPSVGQISVREELGDKFSFLHSSCILARVPYTPLQHPLEIPGFKHLSKWLGKLRPAFMLFLGDFIYIDVPRRPGKDVEAYRKEYRQVYASPQWPLVSSTKHSLYDNNEPYDIPWIHTYDDHEIANDWSANTTSVFPAAFDPYLYYHLATNPPLFLSASATPHDLVADGTLPSWSVFNHGPASFFILDTRRYRNPANAANWSDHASTLLGTAQLFSLLTWLQQPPQPGVKWKFVISSVPFTKNWQGPSSLDTWTGYLYERGIILRTMWKASAELDVGVVVLSGDRHEFAATAFPPPSDSDWPTHATVHEFSCSPLNMFYLPVRTYTEGDEEDVAIKYIPDGNTKFGAVSIAKETLSGQSLLTYRLFVDGKEAWSHLLTAGGAVRPRVQGHTRQQSLNFEHLKDVVKGGRDEVLHEGRQLAQGGEELIGRREEVAARHVEDMREKVGELEQKLRQLSRAFARNLNGAATHENFASKPWVGSRWQSGWRTSREDL